MVRLLAAVLAAAAGQVGFADDDGTAAPERSGLLFETYRDPSFDAVGIADDVRIYVYPLPARCAYEDFLPWELRRQQDRNPPSLPIHEQILSSRYITTDPSTATSFYVPAPLYLYNNEFQGLISTRNITAAFRRSEFFRLGDTPAALPEGAQLSDEAGAALVWFRADLPPDGQEAPRRRRVLATGGAFDLGLVAGCAALLPARGRCAAGDSDWVAWRCSTGLGPDFADGRWHHLAAAHDGRGRWRLFADGDEVGSWQLADAPAGCPEEVDEAALTGEACELQLVAKDLTEPDVKGIPGGMHHPDAPCFRLVRDSVEASPWIHRNGGWDHFVNFGGIDYPMMFTANLPNEEEDYVLEHAWPAFKHFVVVHLGARAELCAGWNSLKSRMDEDCARRLYRMITVPPVFPDERFDCREMQRSMQFERPVRVAYRGLAYSSMMERMAIKNVIGLEEFLALQRTGEIRLEFTNWTHELVGHGICRPSFALEGLCSWKNVNTGRYGNLAMTRATSMRTRSLELWASSQTCLVMPGDGGYELRLYSMINLGCVPVIIYTSGCTLPKLPFPSQLPWHEMAFFWDMGTTVGGLDGADFRTTSEMIIKQLLALDPAVLARKRAALLRHGPSLGWSVRETCGAAPEPGGRLVLEVTAMDLLARELAARAREPEPDLQRRLFWKLPKRSMEQSLEEDVSGSGCPIGFPSCVRGNGGTGDRCFALARGLQRCPVGCSLLTRLPWCGVKATVEVNGSSWLPCRTKRCRPVHPVQADFSLNGFPTPPRRPRIVLLSYSDRPSLRTATWESLKRFCDARPGRYQLSLQTEPLLDGRDFHPAWNKLAHVRRIFTMGEVDAVVWVDDDVVLTALDGTDPLFEAIVSKLFAVHTNFALISASSRGQNATEAERELPVSTAIMVFKRGRQTRGFVANLIRLARKLRWPRFERAWDQSALSEFLWERKHADGMAIMEPGVLWKRAPVVGRPADAMAWRPGDFAVHLSDIPSTFRRVQVARWLLQESSGIGGSAAQNLTNPRHPLLAPESPPRQLG